MKLAILGTGLVALKLNEYLKNDGYLADIYSSRKNKKFLDYKELENNEYDVWRFRWMYCCLQWSEAPVYSS